MRGAVRKRYLQNYSFKDNTSPLHYIKFTQFQINLNKLTETTVTTVLLDLATLKSRLIYTRSMTPLKIIDLVHI